MYPSRPNPSRDELRPAKPACARRDRRQQWFAVRGFPVEVSPEAAAVHEAALVIDLHNDLLTKLTHMPGYDFSREHAPAR